MSGSTAVMSPEVLDALMSDPVTRKALEAQATTKPLVLAWEAAKAARIEAAMAKTDYVLAGQSTTREELAMFLRANAYFIKNDKARKTVPAGALALIDEAVAQLGILMPTSKLWQNLGILAGVSEETK